MLLVAKVDTDSVPVHVLNATFEKGTFFCAACKCATALHLALLVNTNLTSLTTSPSIETLVFDPSRHSYLDVPVALSAINVSQLDDRYDSTL